MIKLIHNVCILFIFIYLIGVSLLCACMIKFYEDVCVTVCMCMHYVNTVTIHLVTK